jgi:3-oxoacyl-[acyl-carrier-protein] synthase III
MDYSLKNIRIAGTGSAVPARIVTNQDLIDKGVPTTDAWIQETLGIRERRIVDDESTSDLAARAGLAAIENAGIDKEDVSLIVLATYTPDRKAPSTACLTKHKMGIVNLCPAFDIVAICSGYIYGMAIAASLIRSGAHKNALVIASDITSTLVDWTRRDCVFFGDGAGAVLLTESNYEKSLFEARIFSDTHFTDGFTVYEGDSTFSMDGSSVYEAATSVLPGSIISVLLRCGLTEEEITWVIPHQPAIRVLKKMADRLGIPFEKVCHNMEKYANTCGATIPLLLDELNRAGKLKKDDLLAFAGVGAGWTFGAALYRWH